MGGIALLALLVLALHRRRYQAEVRNLVPNGGGGGTSGGGSMRQPTLQATVANPTFRQAPPAYENGPRPAEPGEQPTYEALEDDQPDYENFKHPGGGPGPSAEEYAVPSVVSGAAAGGYSVMSHYTSTGPSAEQGSSSI